MQDIIHDSEIEDYLKCLGDLLSSEEKESLRKMKDKDICSLTDEEMILFRKAEKMYNDLKHFHNIDLSKATEKQSMILNTLRQILGTILTGGLLTQSGREKITNLTNEYNNLLASYE